MPPDLGSDLDCINDLPLRFRTCTGNKNLGNALGRRLRTPAGQFFDDPAYGYDVRQLLEDDLAGADAVAAQFLIVTECEKDERVKRASVDTFSFDQVHGRLTIAVSITSSAGPFRLILEITAVNYSFVVLGVG